MMKDFPYPNKDEMLSYVLDFIAVPWADKPGSKRDLVRSNRHMYEILSECHSEAEFNIAIDIAGWKMTTLDFIALVRYAVIKFRLGTNLLLWPWLFKMIIETDHFDKHTKYKTFANNFIRGYHGGPYEYQTWSFPMVGYPRNIGGITGLKHDFDASILFAISCRHHNIAEYIPMHITKDWYEMTIDKYNEFFAMHSEAIHELDRIHNHE